MEQNICFLAQDYVKRIRSTVNHKELRFELSIISDEFASIAKEREIPILTAMQLNIWLLTLKSVINNSFNCWKPLRTFRTTTQLVKAIVNVRKFKRLGNQQPNIFKKMKVQRLSLMGVDSSESK